MEDLRNVRDSIAREIFMSVHDRTHVSIAESLLPEYRKIEDLAQRITETVAYAYHSGYRDGTLDMLRCGK